MDYTKLFKSSNKFKLVKQDMKIQISMEILKDIDKTKILIKNYSRIDSKLDIDEYMAYFLKDKNEFITEFKDYIQNEKNMNPLSRKNYFTILEILKSAIDNVLKDFKNLKQKFLRKLNKKENFMKQKLNFIKSTKLNTNVSINNSKYKVPNIIANAASFLKENSSSDSNIKNNSANYNKNLAINKYIDDAINTERNPDSFKETREVLSMFSEKESKDIEKTKTIISELADLMTNFSLKVLEHQNMTQNIISNASVSLNNAQKANKELIKCQEYQKGRGLIIGCIFILLGLFLIYYDYAA